MTNTQTRLHDPLKSIRSHTEELSHKAGKLDALIALYGDQPSTGANLSREELEYFKWILKDLSHDIFHGLDKILTDIFEIRESIPGDSGHD